MKKLTKKTIQNCIDFVWNNKDGTSYIEMGELPDGRKLCLVFGWDSDYDKGDCAYQDIIGDTVYTICSKLAVNIDDLQCDFDIDWYMPCDKKTNEVWYTMMAVPKNFNCEYYEKQTKAMLEAFNKGEIEV